jgi:type IV pilus assembly protein PilV
MCCYLGGSEHRGTSMEENPDPLFFGKDDHGFSLVEILITLFVLSVGLLAICGLTSGVMRSNAFSNKLTTATTLAQEKIEELRGRGYGGLPSGAGLVSEDYGTIIFHPSFKRIVDTQDPGTPQNRLKKLAVTVYWDGDAHRVVLETLLGE